MAAVAHPEGLRPGFSRVQRDLDVRCRAAIRSATSRFSTPTVSVPEARQGRRRQRLRGAAEASTTTVCRPRRLRCRLRRATRTRAGSSARSPSKSCGGWSIASMSATGAAPRCSPRSDRLVAHGNPTRSGCRLRQRRQPARAAGRRSAPTRLDIDANTADETATRDGAGRSADGPDLHWMVVVEQPTAEALRRRHAPAAAAARWSSASPCSARSSSGSLWGRSFITRIFALHARHPGDCRRALRRARRHDRPGRDEAARRLLQLDGRQHRRSCRRTSGSRSGRRCSAASPPGWCTTSRTRSRTSATAAS